MDFMIRERGRCALVFERIGGTVDAVQRLVLEYKREPNDRIAVRIWSAIAICLEAGYMQVVKEIGDGAAVHPHDAWQLGYTVTVRALKYWQPGRKRGARSSNPGAESTFLSYVTEAYKKALRYEIQERGTLVKIERNTKGYWDRYRAMRNGVVRVDHEPYERLEGLESLRDL